MKVHGVLDVLSDHTGAGDGNRTRTVSLGSHCRCSPITCGDADLRPNGGVPVSARKLP